MGMNAWEIASARGRDLTDLQEENDALKVQISEMKNGEAKLQKVESQWQPIETAPDDGTPFLAVSKLPWFPYWATADVLFIQVVPEDEHDINELINGNNVVSYQGRSAGKYYGRFCEMAMEMEWHATYRMPILDYTHWHPLPPESEDVK